METSEIRPESPVLACLQPGDEESDTTDVIPKKKSQRIKHKMIEKEIAADSTVNGNGNGNDVDVVMIQTEEGPHENVHIVYGDSNGFENGHHQITYEYPFDNAVEQPSENGTSLEPSNGDDVTENNLNFEESTTGSDGTIPVIVDGDTEEEADADDKENRNGIQPETDTSANNVTFPPETSNAEEELQKNDNEHDREEEVNGMPAVNGQDPKEFDQVQGPVIPLNGSDEESFYETVELAREVDESSERATQPADNSFTQRISSFLGKWQTSSPMRDDKQETVDVSSSSKKPERGENSSKPTVPHPYLSKVTGRRGIKMRSNLNGVESETPKNKGPVLSDSFRVKTDPPRLSQAETGLESVLRKYKGKRCLNVNDEDDDENVCENGRELYTKRRKLDEKGSSSGSGFLGNMLWSPFKKKPDEKAVAQSKLSRFLSPFWFWKKTVTDHERN